MVTSLWIEITGWRVLRQWQNEDSGWGDIAVSPDGKKWAFTAGGDVWATTMEGDVPATRVTMTVAAEGDITYCSVDDLGTITADDYVFARVKIDAPLEMIINEP